MTDNIICVSLKRNIRMVSIHPFIERVMQEKVGQNIFIILVRESYGGRSRERAYIAERLLPDSEY